MALSFAQNARESVAQQKLCSRLQLWAEALLPPAFANAMVTVVADEDDTRFDATAQAETFIVVLGSGQNKRMRIGKPIKSITQDDVAAVVNAWSEELNTEQKAVVSFIDSPFTSKVEWQAYAALSAEERATALATVRSSGPSGEVAAGPAAAYDSFCCEAAECDDDE